MGGFRRSVALGSHFRRRVVIVSSDRANATADRLGRGVVTDSTAQAEQVRSVSVERIGNLLGRVPASVMADLDEALRLHLHL